MASPLHVMWRATPAISWMKEEEEVLEDRTPAMRDKDREKGVGCPYFRPFWQSCGLCSKGIYLPLRSEVIAFCLNPEYKECPTYRKYFDWVGLGEEKPKQDKPRLSRERRKHPRYLYYQNVLLCSCDKEKGLEVTATTVDLSPSGMRVLSRRGIHLDNTLCFFFDSDFFIPYLQGVVRLCWNRIQYSYGMVEIGLAFQDEATMQSLSSGL